jgi:ribonuclease P protein component
VPAGDDPPSRGLPRARRLRRATEFRRLYAQGRRLAADGFTAVVLPNDTGSARLGLSVAARLERLAVQRNRVRRIIRESFRAHRQRLPAVDVVVGLRSAPRVADNAQLRRSLEKLWQKINASCEHSSVS